MMLRRNFHQRPSAPELIQLPYVRSCLELSKSQLVEKDRARAAPENTVKPTTTKRIPGTIAEICKFLEENDTRVGCQVAGLEEAMRLIQSKGQQAAPALVPRTVAAMSSYASNVFVQIAGQ